MPDQAQQPRQIGGGRRAIGDLAPKLAEITDDVLFDDVWNRRELAARDRGLITVAALVTGGDADQLPFHLAHARDNGVSEPELIEAITHLAFYAGWPKAMTAITVAKQVVARGPSTSRSRTPDTDT
ncbi:MAG: carboxymuconolactone decarboxylase family protein [Cellulomonas sp.]